MRPAEYELIKGHSRVGSEILQDIAFPWPVAQMILQHHERLDGSGYPDGLRGDEILLGARIIAVADVVDAMATDRPYRAALGIDAALQEIEANRGRLYDPDVVDACLRLHRDIRLDPDASAPRRETPNNAAMTDRECLNDFSAREPDRDRSPSAVGGHGDPALSIRTLTTARCGLRRRRTTPRPSEARHGRPSRSSTTTAALTPLDTNPSNNHTRSRGEDSNVLMEGHSTFAPV